MDSSQCRVDFSQYGIRVLVIDWDLESSRATQIFSPVSARQDALNTRAC